MQEKTVNEKIAEILLKYKADLKIKGEIGLVFQEEIKKVVGMFEIPKRSAETVKNLYPFDLGRVSGFNEARRDLENIIQKIRDKYKI